MADELRTLRLGHARRERRAIKILEDLVAHPGQTIPQACADWAGTKATYRWLNSEHVKPQALRSALVDATVRRCVGQDRILVAQDTTSLDFTSHPQTSDLGPLESSHCRGLLSHSALAMTVAGVPLGLLHQKVWARDEAAPGAPVHRRKRPTSAKESHRWLETVQACGEVVPETTQTIVIGDREADIYDLLAMKRPSHVELLVRATHNRRVRTEPPHETLRDGTLPESSYLWETVRASEVRGLMVVDMQRANHDGESRAGRRAEVELRYQELQLLPPRNGVVGDDSQRVALAPGQGVRVWAVLVEERNPPPGATPLCWLLLSTLPVTSVAEAQECVRWYQQRWKVERYHFVLKSGCKVEELQLATRARLERALALYNVVAWRLLWMAYVARESPEAPCTIALESVEWKALCLTLHPGQPLPNDPPSIRDAVRAIAKLGGFLARNGDGEPGVKVIWRGLTRLRDITNTYVLLLEVLGKG